jgi:uncharacterized membrane protein
MLVLLVLGGILGRPLGPLLFLAGVVVAIAAVPIILPGVLRTVGIILGRQEPVLPSIAGRGMEQDPIRISRPFTAGAALVVLALAGSGYLAFLRPTIDTESTTGDTQAVTVRWLDARPSDLALLSHALGSGLVAPTREEGGALVVGATCHQLARYLPGAVCRRETPYVLPAAMARSFADLIGVPGMSVRLTHGDFAADNGRALVLDRSGLAALHERVRTAAMRVLPAPTVVSELTFVPRESPLTAWIFHGIIVALVALAGGGVVSMVDRLLATRGHRRHLLNLGVSPRGLATLEAWLFAAPYGVVLAVSFSTGLAICALIVRGARVSMPLQAIGTVLGLAAIVGLMGGASVLLFGARRLLREDPWEVR